MIFVLREVLMLRELGFRIETASINPPDRAPEGMTAEEAQEAARTYCVKRDGLAGAARALALTLLSNPAGIWRGFRLAFTLAGLDLNRLSLNLMYFLEALMVGQWMERNHRTHLHVHLGSQAASVGLFVRHVFGFGYSITVHGPDEFYDVAGKYLPQKIEAADFIFCISSFARSQLMKLSPYVHWKKLVVSPLGVDPEHFSARPERPSPEILEILCIGRLTPAKGQHMLLDALERLGERGYSVRLRLVGSGPDEASLREHASACKFPESIVFEGAVNQDRIRTLYAAADLFCLPSFAEGVPVVLMEAMAMEIPCVTTHITGIPELIRDGVDGLLVPPGDVDALVDALARLLVDEDLRQRLGHSGRARVLECYDLRRNVERLAALFGTLMKH
jgi:glycosyltransferase involved in cell wall biosynthesis